MFIPMYIPMAVSPSASPADYTNIHSVAVISALGGKLRMQSHNFLGTKEKDLDISSWNIDGEIEARLRQYLSDRFTFKDVPYDRAALAGIPNGRWDNFFSKFPDFLKSLPRDAVDAYIVVRPDLGAYAPGIEGLGLENGGAFSDITPVVWANYDIDIVDAHTGKVIGQAYSQVRLRDNTPPSFVGLYASDALKVGGDFQITDTQKNILHETVSTALNLSIIETLRALKTGVDLPQAGARRLTPIPPDKNPYKDYKNVAVISALGDDIQLDHMGGTVFSESNYRVPEPDWHIDEHIEKRATDALAQHFTVVKADVDRTALSRATIWDDDGKLAPSFPGLPGDPKVDLFVLFLNLNERMAGVHFTKGLGLFNHTPITEEPNSTSVFAHFAVVTVDAKTMKFVSARAGIVGPEYPTPEPRKDMNNAIWPKSPPAMSAEQSGQIHDGLITILDASIDETLLQLALLGVFPTASQPLPDQAAQQ